MRFLHLSDLHLGKRVCEFSMLDDQRYILEQILSLLDNTPADGVLLAAFLCYVFCCAISVCAVVWVLLSEMYPIRVRGVAMSIAGFSLWTGTYLVGQLTPWMLANLTPAGTFFLFAAMCVPYMLLIWKAVPEMSGRTLEEIERYWTR